MNHRRKEEKYLSVDTSKEIDVFYPDMNDGKIQWVHYDTTQSLVEICVFNKETIRAVNAACWDATGAFQMIREVSNRFLLRPGMDGYEDAIIRMRSDKPAAIGCSYLTLDRLEQFLEAGELLNSYCMREFGCKAISLTCARLTWVTKRWKEDIHCGATRIWRIAILGFIWTERFWVCGSSIRCER